MANWDTGAPGTSTCRNENRLRLQMQTHQKGGAKGVRREIRRCHFDGVLPFKRKLSGYEEAAIALACYIPNTCK